MSDTPTARDRTARLMAGFSLFLSGIATVAAVWQGWLLQKAWDRSTGRVTANLVISSAKPDINEAPDDLKYFVGNGQRRKVFIRVKDFQDLLRLDHRISLKNVGDEPIEAVRVEVRYVKGTIIFRQGKDDPAQDVNHRVVKQNATDEYVLSGKLFKGDEAAVSTVRGIAEQIVDAQDPKHPDKLHKALFEITCYGRLVVPLGSMRQKSLPGS